MAFEIFTLKYWLPPEPSDRTRRTDGEERRTPLPAVVPVERYREPGRDDEYDRRRRSILPSDETPPPRSIIIPGEDTRSEPRTDRRPDPRPPRPDFGSRPVERTWER